MHHVHPILNNRFIACALATLTMYIRLNIMAFRFSVYHSLTSYRCLSYNINCIEANRMFVLNLLAREGKCEDAAGSLSDLVQLLDLFEPRNHSLYYDMSLAFSRLVRPYVFFLIHLYLPCVCVSMCMHSLERIHWCYSRQLL